MSCHCHAVVGVISGRVSCFVMCVACCVFGVVYGVFCVEATQISMRPLKILQEARLTRNCFFVFSVFPGKVTLPQTSGPDRTPQHSARHCFGAASERRGKKLKCISGPLPES